MSAPRLSQLLSALHRDHLKPAGFRKEGSTFSRAQEVYTERFHFQGSSWSSGDETRFYLNAGVEFADYEPGIRNWMYLKNTHWACRIDRLVRGAPEHWDCSEATDQAGLARDLARLIESASGKMAARLDTLREDYLSRTRPRE